MKSIAVHGGLDLLGENAEVKNQTLDVLAEDPDLLHIGRIWFNASIGRVGYSDSSVDLITAQHIANIADVNALKTIVDSKATVADVNAIMHRTVINNTTNDLILGQPVFANNNGSVDKATAIDIDKKEVIGLIASPIITSNGGSGQICPGGIISGTVQQWETVTGMIGGLVPNKKYFLDIEAGKLTLDAPTEPGQFICMIGKALSTTDFFIRVERPIAI